MRNFATCPLTKLTAICDADPQRLSQAGENYAGGGTTMVSSVDELLQLDLDAVVIATPVGTHFPLASRCLEAGLHVLVEKPLAASVEHAEALVQTAVRCDRVLMVDHTYLFSSSIRRIKQLVEQDELGELYFIDGIRINLGLFQRDINVIWDLAPHDLSIMDSVMGLGARSISAWGCAHASPAIEDLAYINVDFGDQLMANFHVNWLSPVKVRQMIFAGKRKSLVFDELNATEPIKIYDRGIEMRSAADAQRQLQLGYRTGDIWSPHIQPIEALQTMVSHFADCVLNGTTCESDGQMGVRVVRYLEAATRSIRAQGGRIVLSHDHAQNSKGNHVNSSYTRELSQNLR
jgi:predicted dehydrogenase